MSRISKTFSKADWLNLDFNSPDVWNTAVGIFQDRIGTRFIKPLERLLPIDGAGFLVMAIHCLLMELLEQFRRGENDTPPRNGQDFFVSFLGQPEFGFTENQAKTFYDHFRCGLHHQGQTKKDSRIVMKGALLAVQPDGESLSINRTELHDALVRWINNYSTTIRQGLDPQVRHHFKKKMDYICS